MIVHIEQQAFVVPESPCSACDHLSVVGLMLRDAEGGHDHTKYHCTYWGAGPCGWSGWFVPDATMQPCST